MLTVLFFFRNCCAGLHLVLQLLLSEHCLYPLWCIIFMLCIQKGGTICFKFLHSNIFINQPGQALAECASHLHLVVVHSTIRPYISPMHILYVLPHRGFDFLLLLKASPHRLMTHELSRKLGSQSRSLVP